MFTASIFAHSALGALLSIVFILYYINGEGKWKILLETLIGAGGNISGIFLLDQWLHDDNSVTRMYAVGFCIASFVICTVILLVIISFVIKDKDDKNIIRLRDIMLGQTSWIEKYYEKRAKEIDNKLNIAELQKREEAISFREHEIEGKEKHLQEETEKLENLAKNKLRFFLPENASIILNKEYIEAMPS